MIIKGLNLVRQYWRKCMDSAHNKISRGAEQIHRIMPHARGENWRGGSNRHDNKK